MPSSHASKPQLAVTLHHPSFPFAAFSSSRFLPFKTSPALARTAYRTFLGPEPTSLLPSLGFSCAD